MVTLKQYDFATKSLGDVNFDESIFGDRARVRCLRAAALMYAANRRQGTVDTRERSYVAGTTKKPWKQKHTGRARSGSKKSPIWRGGGTIFGPHPRDFGYARPRTELRVALRGALYGKLVDQEVGIVKGLSLDKPSSKACRGLLSAFEEGLGDAKSALVVLPAPNAHVWRSLRNYPRVEVRTADDVNAEDVLRNRFVILTDEAATKFKGGLRGIAVTASKSAKSSKSAPTSKSAAAPKEKKAKKTAVKSAVTA
jgi:large subunit ribosomal protein L4